MNVKQYLVFRFFRIATLYFFLLAIHLIFNQALGWIKIPDYEASVSNLPISYYLLYAFMLPEFTVLLYQVFTPILAVAWSVGVEVLFYLFLPLLITRKRRVLISLLVFVAYIILILGLEYLGYSNYPVFQFVSNLSVSSLMAGCLAAWILPDRKTEGVLSFIFMGAAVTCITSLVLLKSYSIVSAGIYPLSVSILIRCLSEVNVKGQVVASFSKWLGNVSYNMYLFLSFNYSYGFQILKYWVE